MTYLRVKNGISKNKQVNEGDRETRSINISVKIKDINY